MTSRVRGRSALAGAVAVAVCLAVPLATMPAGAQDEVAVLQPVGESPGPEQDPAAVAAQVDKLAKAPVMGKKAGTLVIDAETDRTLYDDDGNLALIPASTNKIAMAAAVLRTAGVDRRLRTRTALAGGGDSVFLIGGGDPLLVSRQPLEEYGRRPYPKWTSLRRLATDTAAALRDRNRTTVTLHVDDSLFTGPAWGRGWPEYYRTSGIAAPVSALLVDRGRIGGRGPIAEDPAMAGGETFAKLLRGLGITVAGVNKQKAPETADQLAAVESAPISQLVGEALLWSNNDTAESLFRLAGHYGGFGGSFDGGSKAVNQALEEMGISPVMCAFHDGSGLSPDDRITPNVLVQILRRAVQSQEGLWPITSGLAVAGVTGTLQHRFDDPDSESAGGWVRAKTGTLNYVSSLAGYMQSRSGRILIFASLANEATSSFDAAAMIDRIAGRLADCGCPGDERDSQAG